VTNWTVTTTLMQCLQSKALTPHAQTVRLQLVIEIVEWSTMAGQTTLCIVWHRPIPVLYVQIFFVAKHILWPAETTPPSLAASP